MSWMSDPEKKSRKDKCYEALDKISKFKSIVVYDLETTGLNPKADRILQYSAIRFSLPEFKEMDRIDLYINCPFSVPAEITAINRIDDQVLAEKGIDDIEAYKKMKDFMHPDDLISGYNIATFDNNFMETFYKLFGSHFEYADILDALPLAKNVVDPDSVMAYNPKRKGYAPSYKLCTITEHYGLINEIEFHSSIEDVKATGFVLKNLIDEVKKMQAEDKPEKIDFMKRQAKVNSISWFAPSNTLQRVYVNTSQGTYYYDSMKRKWDAKPGKGNTDSIDMDQLRSEVLTLKNVRNEDELIELMKAEAKKSA